MKKSPFKMMAISSMIVSQFVGSTLIGLFIGKKADQYFQTTPILIICGLFCGMIIGAYSIYLSFKN
ncbi:MAG: AtpZ/AtpI family protein, partial [Bacilli bacterium]